MTNKEWIIERLPKYLPDEIVNDVLEDRWRYVKELKVMEHDDRGSDLTVYSAKDENDLLLWQFKDYCNRIANKLEVKNRENNSLKFRYIYDHVKDGEWYFIEHKNFEYNAIEDTRVIWFEEYLRLISSVVSKEEWNGEVSEKVSLLNTWFKEKHWDYDEYKMCFIEVSNSEQFDSKGNRIFDRKRIVKVI